MSTSPTAWFSEPEGHALAGAAVIVPTVLLARLARDAHLGHTLRTWGQAALAQDSAEAVALAEDWHRIAISPTFVQLQQRRGDTAAASHGDNPLDEVFSRPRPLSATEQRQASRMLDTAFGATDETGTCVTCGRPLDGREVTP